MQEEAVIEEPLEEVVEVLVEESEDTDEVPSKTEVVAALPQVEKKAIPVATQEPEEGQAETSKKVVVLPENTQAEASTSVQAEQIPPLAQSITSEEDTGGEVVLPQSSSEKDTLSLEQKGKPTPIVLEGAQEKVATNSGEETFDSAREVILLEGGISPQDAMPLFPLSQENTSIEVPTEGKPEEDGEIHRQGVEGGTRRKISAVDEIVQLLQEPTGQELIASFVASFAHVDSGDVFPTVSSEPIDVFRAVDVQETTLVSEPKIQVRQEGERIVIGAQKTQEGNVPLIEATDEMHPGVESMAALSTVEELAKALDVLAKFTLDTPKQAKMQTVVEGKEAALDTVVLKEVADAEENETPAVQENTPTEITILVSDELMTFIDTGKKVLEALEKRKARLSGGNTLEQEVVQKKLVRITSGQKEIIIELEMLKKLIELHKMKGQIASRMLIQKNETALEELGLHPMKPQWDDMQAFWFVYQLVVFSLTSIEDTQLFSYDRIVPRHVASPVLHA